MEDLHSTVSQYFQMTNFDPNQGIKSTLPALEGRFFMAEESDSQLMIQAYTKYCSTDHNYIRLFKK